MRKPNNVWRYVFFKNEEQANRFAELYGGLVNKPEGAYHETSCNIYGKEVKGLWEVMLNRITKKEFDEISKDLGLVKKKSTNHFRYRQDSYYVFD